MKRYKYFIPAIAWMAVIFGLSTALFGAEETGSIVEWVVRAIAPGLPQPDIDTIHFLIRKAAHVSEYAVLLLLWRRGFTRLGLGEFKAVSVAFVISAAYAASDEYHQSFVANRTASAIDVLIDMTGAAAAILVLELVRLRKKQRVV